MIPVRSIPWIVAMVLLLPLIVLTALYLGSRAIDPSTGKTRIYYIAAVEEDWNYLPETTVLSEQQHEYSEKYLIKQENPLRLGHIYKKAVFREFKDSTYTERQPRERWQGLLGPVLKGEVGDVLEIHLLNNLSRSVSLHTHGVRYEKHHEGAFYLDNTIDKKDDKILPGHNYTYYWQIPSSRSPTASDPECMLWAYHSHVFGDTDIHTGLIGPLIVCKPGSLAKKDSLSTFSSEYVLLFLIFDENQSWYLNDNIDYATKNETEREELIEDESFQESNLMYSINGYMYDNLPALEPCLGSEVTWYVMGMGNEADIHAVTFEGHPLTINEHRTDVIHLFPGRFLTAYMKANYEGNWPIKSEVGDHSLAGMQGSFYVKNCSVEGTKSAEETLGTTRKYFVAAEEVQWNYAPTGINRMNNVPLVNDSEAAAFFERSPTRIGGMYKKVLYREYTDEAFDKPKLSSTTLGILGPTLRAEVGDILEIMFFNKATRPYNLFSTAFVCLDYSLNGMKNETIPVYPGENKTFRFLISETLGPGNADSQCITYRYFSNLEPLKDIYSGLNGFLLICRPESLNEEGLQKFVDKEYALMFGVIDENESHYIEENIGLYIGDNTTLDTDDPDFVESNLMHSINGFMYGNLIGLDLCARDNVSWLLMAIGHEVDLHVAHFWNNAFLHRGQYKDTIELLPGSHFVVTMTPDTTGTHLLQCQTNDHIKGGMQAFYTVKNCDVKKRHPSEMGGKVNDYFIAVVEEEWDYAPTDIHTITGQKLTENRDSKVFVTNDDTHIGSRYIKALYREYTDSSFQIQKPRTDKNEHLGFLGPFIKAAVGDVINITFLNNGSHEYNIRPHGLIEITNDTDPVAPGETKIYIWEVPERSGPTAGGFNCTNWIYYSAVDSVKDTNSGLMGPLVICNPGVLDVDGSRKDVDKEFSVLFTVMDENESWYLESNIQRYCHKPENVDVEDEDFKESNLKHSMNGRLYGTLDGLNGTVGDKVAWYLMGMGNEVDMHTAHFHGLTAIEKDDVYQKDGRLEDVVDLSPGIFRTVEMTLDSPGTWMFHCHVDDHLKAGMLALFTVNPAQ